MLNNTIYVLFNTKELHKMAKSIKKKNPFFFNRLCDYTIGYVKDRNA